MLGLGEEVELADRVVGGAFSILLLIDAGGYPVEVLLLVVDGNGELARWINYGTVDEGEGVFESVEGYEWTQIHVLSSGPTVVR